MIDLSFLTDEEQESILKVLQRDADLKKIEEERIRNLPEKVKNDAQVKNMSGQWFYEAKSKRHKEKIQGADIIRASIRRKPLTIAELSQSKLGNAKSSWVNNVNKEIFVSPEQLGVIQDKEDESKSNHSPKMSNTLQKPQEGTRKPALSPSKQRKNPFNDSSGPEDNAKTEYSENGMVNSSETTEEENQRRANLPNYSRAEASAQPSVEFRQTGKLPVPKARKNVHKTSDANLQNKDSLSKASKRIKQVNSQGRPPKSILKRSSSSSSTDSEVLRLSQTLEPSNKSGLPTSTILEDVAEKSCPSGEDYSQNSLDRLKQVRFSSSVSKNERPPNLELHEGKELGEFNLLDTNSTKAGENEVNYLDSPSFPAKPARSYSPALDGNVKDGQESRDGKTRSGSYSLNDSNLPSLVKSPPAEAALPGEPSRQMGPSTMDNETLPSVTQPKTKQLNPEPCDATQGSTGQELRLAEAEEAELSNTGCADLKQGKPDLVGRSVDKHAAENLKAADESISKVLDWFKRSSSTADKETVLITPQQRQFTEEMDAPKSVKLSAIGEDKESNTELLNLKSSLYERGESTSKDSRFQDILKQPEQLSFSKSESPSEVVLGDQAPLNRSKENVNAASHNIHINKRTRFQTIDQSEDKMDESNRKDICEVAFEDKTYMDLKNSEASFRSGVKRETSSQIYTDGERDVKSFLEEENSELKSGETLKDPEGKDCNFQDTENKPHANNRSNLVLQQHELRQPSVIGDKKRVKDMKAFWEGGKVTPELGNKEVLTNENMSSNTQEYGRIKPVSGSSGYVTSESDNEQSKYNLVTFRKVELSEEESEMKGDDVTCSGTSRPIQGDKCTENQDINISNEVLSNDQKNANIIGVLNESNLQPSYRVMASPKESERPKATVLEKGTLQPKSPFKIHSLKEKMDEESRSQMLNPSQFQSLRNFWDMGTKPQSKTDETIPQTHRSSSTGSCTKELQERIGSSQAILDDGRSGFSLQEEEMKKPTANTSHQSPLAEAMFSPSATTVPMHLDYALTRDDDSSPVLPGKEHAGIKEISPEIQHNKVVNSGFQPTALVEEFQESSCPPIHDKGIPCVELVGKGQMAPNDQIQEPSFVPLGTNGKAGLKTSEVVEIVSRTLVPPKAAGADAFSTSLEKLLKETSDLQASLRHHIIMDVSEPADLTSEKRDFFNKVMERSHHSYPSDPEESREGSQTEGTMEKHHLLQTQPVEFTTSMGSLPRSLEELKPVPVKVSNKEDGQMYFSDNRAWEKNLLIPSLELIQPDTCGAAQNRTDSPEEDVLETVSKNNVPPNRKCSDLNAKLIHLLKESATWPRTQDILETSFDDVPKENQQKSYQQMNEKKDFASLQTSNHLREAVGETAKENKDTNKDGRVLIVMQDGTTEVTKQYADPKERIQGELAGKQPVDTMETVVKTMKPKSYDPAAFRANLKQILDEDSTGLLGDIKIPKLTHSSLQPDQSVSSACAKDTWNSQEVIERVEKSTVPSNSRQVEFKARFQTLLKENPEILPCSQKITENSNGMQINKKSTENIGFISSQETDCGQEVNETANNISALPRFQPREFNSSLQKLLKEAAQTPPSQRLNLPQEETIMKSVVPAKDGQALKSNLEKLISEHLDPASRPPTVDCQKVTSDSTSNLDEQRSPVEMSRDYRSELKIPLTEKASKQTDEGAKLSEDMAFQKIIHLSLASSETPCLEKDKDFSSTADKAEDRSIQGKEAEFSTSLIDANRSLMVERGLQRSSTPLAGSPIQSGEVELYHAAPPAGDGHDVDGDAKNCESDFSDGNKSVLGSQRDPICSEEELNPVMKALKRNSNRQIPSKSVEDIPSATSNKEKINLAREDLVLSAEDVSTAPSFSDSQFSRPEKIKMMSKSVPAFLQDESDDRETDTASESSYLHGRITKSPSSLTNLSGSSGLASLSSVSTSVMSVYSGDFGNVDVKGNLQFAIDYVEQLKEFHIFIAQGKDLAIADMKRQRSDPYVKSYLLPEKHKLGKRKTSVKKKTLNPVYNEILRYKIDKAILESQSLNVSVWHHDTFGRNSFLGEVELDLANWDWSDNQNKQMIWYPLKPRTPLKGLDLENRGEIKIALQYVPQPVGGKKTSATGEVHIWVKQCNDLPMLRGPKLNSFVKCTVLPDTSRKSRQKTRAVAKTTDPIFNHTMVYDGFRPKDLKEACVELTVWDHNKLANHFLGGLRIGLGTGKSYGVPVDWMDSTLDEANLWERMINSPNTWVEDTLPLRMLMVAKMTK
ncbi:synaptotagmin-like protein 2 isoform X2 [Crotalus tigris]|uniref:synaptotagmin-like protein 2 isoform X2 n=1 Tax=Crotalus tigris TaxID=88082 RepID=UPI00192F681A|nr:synaptotagmin-like protein 2 isoform X2 [Crotalus tigris]